MDSGKSAKAMNSLLVQLPEEGAVCLRGATVGHKHASTHTDVPTGLHRTY